MDENKNQQVDKLRDKIWITRKIRINTETRLKCTGTIFSWIVSEYSVFLIFLGITGANSILSVLGSVVILVLSIIVANQQYSLRAYRMREHYINLDSLYKKLESAPTDFLEVEGIYEQELRNIENHTEMDYCKTYNELKNRQTTITPPSRSTMLMYSVACIGKFLGIAVLSLPPIVYIFWWFL